MSTSKKTIFSNLQVRRGVFKRRQYLPLTATRKCPLNWIGLETFYSNQTLLNVLYEIHEPTNRQDAAHFCQFHSPVIESDCLN
jgi:hypothetical protein